jgi:hypothetical protein
MNNTNNQWKEKTFSEDKNMDTQIVKASTELERPMRVEDVLEQVALIQKIMHSVMKEGEHYGVIPGTGTKPSLLKPGAEKLSFTFRLSTTYAVAEQYLDRDHIKYRVVCTLRNQSRTGEWQGVGTCSTMESKYRFRTGPKEPTGKAVPHEYWQMRKSDPAKALELIGGKGHVVGKEDGIWQIFKQGERVENDNPADQYNTALKMAKKRAHVDAVLTATAASDIFTQDVEEIQENLKVATQEPEEHSFQQDAKDALFGAQKPSQPADWTEVGVYFGENATEAQRAFEGVPLGELRKDQLEWAFKWMQKRLEDESTIAVTPRERAMINGLLAWKRETTLTKRPNPMTSEQFQQERERQQAETQADINDWNPAS